MPTLFAGIPPTLENEGVRRSAPKMDKMLKAKTSDISGSYSVLLDDRCVFPGYAGKLGGPGPESGHRNQQSKPPPKWAKPLAQDVHKVPTTRK